MNENKIVSSVPRFLTTIYGLYSLCSFIARNKKLFKDIQVRRETENDTEVNQLNLCQFCEIFKSSSEKTFAVQYINIDVF